MQTDTAGAQGPGKPDQVGGIPAQGRGLELVGFRSLFPPKPSYDFVILSCTQASANSKNPSHQIPKRPLLDALILSSLLINIPSGFGTVHYYYLLYPSCHTLV